MKGNRKSKPVVVRGSQLLPFTVASSNQSVALNVSPALFTRTNSLQGSFEFYRFTKLKCELLPAFQASSTSLADVNNLTGVLGYLPEELTATSTTITAAISSQLESHVSHTLGFNGAASGVASGIIPGHTVSKTMTVPRRILLETPVKMYVCAATTEDALVQQGTLIYALDSSNSAARDVVANVDVRYEIEFFVPTTASLTVVKPVPLCDDDSKEEAVLIEPPVRALLARKRSAAKLTA